MLLDQLTNIRFASLEALSQLVTKRRDDLFTEDIRLNKKPLRERLAGRKVLIVGGAGSVGSATTKAFLQFDPDAVHVVDQNENSLAELVRDLRNSSQDLTVRDFRALPIDFGSTVMRRFLLDNGPYDFVLNFAALKHVRSEKDIYSLLQMLDTNIVKATRFLEWLTERDLTKNYFCVSTDKAVNPVSLMGACKRLMELIMFSEQCVGSSKIRSTSARFANVAFSDGSLLDSFLKRMAKMQPLAVPVGVRRYFISMREAGQICLLASVCAPNRMVLIPKLDRDQDLLELESLAKLTVEYYGFVPCLYEDERQAQKNTFKDIQEGRYPVLRTNLVSSGEKTYEEFVGDDEKTIDIGMPNLRSVETARGDNTALDGVLKEIKRAVSLGGEHFKKEDIVSLLSSVMLHFRHKETHKSLDEQI